MGHVLGGSDTSCLRTYHSDGVTVDTTYPEDCHYDPRHTPWYVAGRENTGSGASQATIVGSLYPIGATGKLGMGVAIKCFRGDFVGTWFVPTDLSRVASVICGDLCRASEFVLDSVGTFMAQIKNGLHGTIFIASADPSGH